MKRIRNFGSALGLVVTILVPQAAWAFGPFQGRPLRLQNNEFYFQLKDECLLVFWASMLVRHGYSMDRLRALVRAGAEISFNPRSLNIFIDQGCEVTGVGGYRGLDRWNPSEAYYTGVEGSNEIAFFDGNQTFIVNTDRVSLEQAAQMQRAVQNGERYHGFVTPLAVRAVDHSSEQYSIHPNCAERALSYESLISLARGGPSGGNAAPSSGSPDMISFLRSIPQGTLQKFTFVYDSQSAQNEDHQSVNRDFPRVIRFNRDSTLMMAYTCDPRGSAYGTVEIIRWNASARQYQFSELDFRSRNMKVNVQGRRVPRHESNPTSCNRCHSAPAPAPPDPRPNWRSYSQWAGVYGGNDDFLSNTEMPQYRHFREMQRDNPCYSTLPWPQGRQDQYPFRTVTRDFVNSSRYPDLYPYTEYRFPDAKKRRLPGSTQFKDRGFQFPSDGSPSDATTWGKLLVFHAKTHSCHRSLRWV